MIIEKISINKHFDWLPIIRTFGLSVFVLSLTIPAFLIVLGSIAGPTGSPISPLPSGEVAIISPTPSVIPFAQSLNLSQNYLDKAYSLSQNTAQTPADKKEIIDNLNLSLNYVTSAINQNNSDPRGYLMRAQILTAVSKVRPEAIKEAQADLDVASKLSNGNQIQLPQSINPINLIPDERAATASNIIVALPNEASQSATSITQGSNSSHKTIVVPAGQTEFVVNDSSVLDTSYIYLIPSNKQTSVSLKSKTAGLFTLELLTPLTNDLPLDYWIINQ